MKRFKRHGLWAGKLLYSLKKELKDLSISDIILGKYISQDIFSFLVSRQDSLDHMEIRV